jgi:hypothetical protein
MASTAPPAAGRRPTTCSISRIVAVAGPERLQAYIDEVGVINIDPARNDTFH